MIVKETLKHGSLYGAFTGFMWMPITGVLAVFFALFTSSELSSLALGNLIYSPIFAVGGLLIGGILGVLYGVVLYFIKMIFGFDYIDVSNQLIRASILIVAGITIWFIAVVNTEFWISGLVGSILFFWIPETGFIFMNKHLIRVLKHQNGKPK